MRNLKQIEDAFSPRKIDQVQSMAVAKVTVSMKEAASDILDLVPDCPMRTTALNAILEAKWCAVQAISHPDNHKIGEPNAKG